MKELEDAIAANNADLVCDLVYAAAINDELDSDDIEYYETIGAQMMKDLEKSENLWTKLEK